MVIYWKIFFGGMHCFMISICGAEPQFNDGTNKRNHSPIYHQELEQSKKLFLHEKVLLLKSPQNT